MFGSWRWIEILLPLMLMVRIFSIGDQPLFSHRASKMLLVPRRVHFPIQPVSYSSQTVPKPQPWYVRSWALTKCPDKIRSENKIATPINFCDQKATSKFLILFISLFPRENWIFFVSQQTQSLSLGLINFVQLTNVGKTKTFQIFLLSVKTIGNKSRKSIERKRNFAEIFGNFYFHEKRYNWWLGGMFAGNTHISHVILIHSWKRSKVQNHI